MHDVSDIFIDILKMANRAWSSAESPSLCRARILLPAALLVVLKLEGPKGWFISEIAYVASVIAWAYYRLYEYPFRVMHSSFILAYRVTAQSPRSVSDDSFFGLITPDLPLLLYNNVLLGTLFFMHIYWFYLLLRVGYRIITESAAQASRSK